MTMIVNLRSVDDLRSIDGVKMFAVKGMFVEYYSVKDFVIYRVRKPKDTKFDKKHLIDEGWKECEGIEFRI